MKECNCTAYTNADQTRDGVGCHSWHGDLVDMSTYTNIRQDIYTRVDAITLGTITIIYNFHFRYLIFNFCEFCFDGFS